MRIPFIFIIMFTLAGNAAPAFTASGVSARSEAETGCTLRIHVDGLRNQSGVIGAAIFKSPDGWPDDMRKSLHHWPTPIPSGAHGITAQIDSLPAADYGVVVIHDENSNRKLDRNFVGIPKEGFGFANNPRVVLTAPSFQAARLHVACPATDTTIHLIYK
jgi:uncharacterized protein (DUF2141 family)